MVESAAGSGNLTTLRRGLRVLELLKNANPTSSMLSNQQIADALGLDKSSVSRTLQVLVETGFASRSEDGRTFAPGPATYSIGARSVDQDLLRASATVVREVVRLTHARTYLTVRNNLEVVTLWSDQPVDARPRVHSIGTSFLLGVSEAGRALLYSSTGEEIELISKEMKARGVGHADILASQIERDKRAGFSWRRSGESGVAVPVWSADRNRVIASLGVASETLSARPRATEIAQLMASAASNLSIRLARVRANQAVGAEGALPFSGWPHIPTDMFPLTNQTTELHSFPELLGH